MCVCWEGLIVCVFGGSVSVCVCVLGRSLIVYVFVCVCVLGGSLIVCVFVRVWVWRVCYCVCVCVGGVGVWTRGRMEQAGEVVSPCGATWLWARLAAELMKPMACYWLEMIVRMNLVMIYLFP